MVVSKDKHRRLITFPKDLEEKLEILANKDNRNFNNYVIHILKKHIEEIEKENNKPHSN